MTFLKEVQTFKSKILTLTLTLLPCKPKKKWKMQKITKLMGKARKRIPPRLVWVLLPVASSRLYRLVLRHTVLLQMETS